MCFKYLLSFSVLLNTFVCKVKHKKQNKLYLMGEKDWVLTILSGI